MSTKITTSKTEIPIGRRAGERGGLQSTIRSLKELQPGEALRVHKDFGGINEETDRDGSYRQKMLYSSLQFASRRTGIKINCQVTSDGTGDVLVWLRGAR